MGAPAGGNNQGCEWEIREGLITCHWCKHIRQHDVCQCCHETNVPRLGLSHRWASTVALEASLGEELEDLIGADLIDLCDDHQIQVLQLNPNLQHPWADDVHLCAQTTCCHSLAKSSTMTTAMRATIDCHSSSGARRISLLMLNLSHSSSLIGCYAHSSLWLAEISLLDKAGQEWSRSSPGQALPGHTSPAAHQHAQQCRSVRQAWLQTAAAVPGRLRDARWWDMGCRTWSRCCTPWPWFCPSLPPQYPAQAAPATWKPAQANASALWAYAFPTGRQAGTVVASCKLMLIWCGAVSSAGTQHEQQHADLPPDTKQAIVRAQHFVVLISGSVLQCKWVSPFPYTRKGRLTSGVPALSSLK